MNVFQYKKLLLAVCMSCSVLACGQADEAADAAVEVQAHLGLAEVYKNQGQFRASVIEATNAYNLMPQDVDVLAFIGGLYLEIGDTANAIRQIEAGLAIDPDNTRLKLLLAEAYLGANRIDEGLALVQDLQVPPEDQSQRDWLLGNFQAANDDLEAARATFENILANTENSHVPSLISLSKVAYLGNDFNRANQLAEQATTVASQNDEDLWIWRGQLAMLQEDYPAAEQAFLEALDIMALQDVMTAKRYGTLQSILVPLQMQQKNDEALRFSQIIAASPQGEFNSAFSNVVSLFQQGDADQARSALDNLLAMSPNNPASNILAGIASYSEGDFQQAQRLLSQYVDASTASSQMIITLASTHLRMNQPQRALSVLEEALANKPDDTDLMAMIGVIQRGLGNIDQSVATLTEALEKAPDSKQLQVALAASHTQGGNYDEALALLRPAIAADPNFNEAKALLLEVHVRQEDVAAARATVQDWIRQDDSVYNNMAAALVEVRAQDMDASRRYLERVLALEPDNVQGQLFLGRIDLQERNFPSASSRFEAVLQQQPTNTDALSGLLAAADMNGAPQEGIAKVEQMIAANPEQFLTPLVLSHYFLARDDAEAALRHAETAYARAGNTYTRATILEASQRLAAAALQQNDIAKARTLMTRAAEVDPESVQVYSILAGIEARAGNFAAAKQHIDQLRAQYPDQPASYELEGDLFRAQSDNSSALTAYRRAWSMQRSPGIGVKIYQVYTQQGLPSQATDFLNEWMAADAEEMAPRLLMAMEMQDKAQNEQAIVYYEQVAASDPNNLIMLNNLAWLYQDIRPERALELASRAAQLYPQNADVLDTYGWVLHKQNEKEQAIAVLEQAAQLAPDNAAIREHLDVVRQ